MRSSKFEREAHRQSLRIARSAHERDDQAFVDAVSDWPSEYAARVWTVAGGAEYVGKPRPAVVLRDDAFNATASITICICSHWSKCRCRFAGWGPRHDSGRSANGFTTRTVPLRLRGRALMSASSNAGYRLDEMG